ncbi:MAG: hypothetical protein HY954_04695 [Deltaproteobacteria bacterium]|nr:hypothetical protein [Deltaproteobacteria bacterium]
MVKRPVEPPETTKEKFCAVCGNRTDECVCCPECGHACLLDGGEQYCPVCGPVEPVTDKE